jgi:hypothetical protein
VTEYISNIKFSEFPDDLQAADALLYNMGMTHVVSLSPAQLELPHNVMNSIIHRHVNIPTYRPESLIVALPEICDFIRDATSSGGQVLVHCVIESRACIVVTAYCELSFSSSFNHWFNECSNVFSRDLGYSSFRYDRRWSVSDYFAT